MHHERTCETPSTAPTPAQHDRSIQTTLFIDIMVLHPAQLTQGELIRNMASNPDDFAERDDITRAIRDLARDGLLHRHGPFVLPTRAAVAAYGLLQS